MSYPGRPEWSRAENAKQEALQRARLQHGPDHAQLPREVASNRVSDWFSGHPVATVALMFAAAVAAVIVLFS